MTTKAGSEMTLPFLFTTKVAVIFCYLATKKAPLGKASPIKGDKMLQRYDISMDDVTNRLSIREYAVIGRKTRKSEYYDFSQDNFSLIHEVTYDVDMIRTAVQEGSEALISELRSDAFFPVEACAKIIAESVTDLFNGHPEPASEVFFDDRILLSTFNEK